MKTKPLNSKSIFLILSVFLALSVTTGVTGQTVEGCTDSRASNFNPQATVNDGSCIFPFTVYNPAVKYLLPQEVEETSGLSYFNGKFWTINDSGGLPMVYGLDTLSGEVVQRIAVKNATNRDWESLATDEEYLYIGDFGNNSGNRDDLGIYKLPLSEFPAMGDAEIAAEFISFEYEDQPKEQVKRKENNYDCEAFLAAGDSLYLFSKNWGNQETRLYALPKTPGTHRAVLLNSFDCKGLITGADRDTVSNTIVLTGYTNQSWVPFMWLLYDYPESQFFSGNKRRIDMLNLPATQVEAIAFSQPYTGLITSEGHVLFSQTAFGIQIRDWVSPSFSFVENNTDKHFDFRLSPNPATGNKVFVDIIGAAHKELVINVYDSSGKQLVQPERVVKHTNEGNNRIKLKINQMKPGLYFVRLSCDGYQLEKKLMVQ